MSKPTQQLLVTTLITVIISISVAFVSGLNDRLHSIDKELTCIKRELMLPDEKSISIEITIPNTYSNK